SPSENLLDSIGTEHALALLAQPDRGRPSKWSRFNRVPTTMRPPFEQPEAKDDTLSSRSSADRPSQRTGSRCHLLNDLLAVFLVAVSNVDAPSRHRIKSCVHGLARLIRKSSDRHRIDLSP